MKYKQGFLLFLDAWLLFHGPIERIKSISCVVCHVKVPVNIAICAMMNFTPFKQILLLWPSLRVWNCRLCIASLEVLREAIYQVSKMIATSFVRLHQDPNMAPRAVSLSWHAILAPRPSSKPPSGSGVETSAGVLTSRCGHFLYPSFTSKAVSCRIPC